MTGAYADGSAREGRTAARRLAGLWLRQGLSWYALTEVALRVLLEGGFVLVLLLAGAPVAIAVLAWLGFHTVAWVVLYGGFFMIWKVAGTTTRVERLRVHRDWIVRGLEARTPFRLAFLRGSAARDDLHEGSDLDFLFVGDRSIAWKVAGVLAVWRLRAASVVRRIPLEARWVDSESALAYHLRGETPRLVARRSRPDDDVSRRLARRGLLVTFSGIDGSGKTTLARRLVDALRAEGHDAMYFWGHWRAWYMASSGPDLGLGVLYRSLWKRLGRSMDELERHPGAKFLFDAFTSFDYVYIRWRIAAIARPNRILVTDRYVADLLAYLRSQGPVKESLEGLVIGMSVPADLSFVFALDPRLALERKRERPLAQLVRFDGAYRELEDSLGLVRVDASRTPDAVFDDVAHAVRSRLGIPIEPRAEAPA
jgi:dTMP kinase